MAYIGGVGFFAGPIVGAVIITFLQITLSDVTERLAALFRPDVHRRRALRARRRRRLADAALGGDAARASSGASRPPTRSSRPALAAGLAGAVMLIELANRQLALARSEGSAMRLFGFEVDASTAPPGSMALVLFCAGAGVGLAALAEGRRGLGRRRRASSRRGPSMIAALSLIDLHKSFGLLQIIRGVSLEIAAGERHAIIGPNGAGKSTLFHLVSGRIAPTSGEMRAQWRAHRRTARRSRSIAAASRAASRSPTSSPSCRSTKTCAAPRSGRSVTDTRSGRRSTACATSAKGRNG